jgi:LPXTG-motif cell wall-anchored protein
MGTIDTQTWSILAGIVLLLLFAAGAWVSFKKKQSQRLQQRFGPEYGRTVNDLRSRTKAESELKLREKRVERLNIVALVPSEAATFRQAWEVLQGHFVDNPKDAVAEAEQLVCQLMLTRGYPMGDFDRRAADISVDHPAVVDNYRAAQAIALRDVRGEADTEELRKAMVHFRALFNELLEAKEPKQELKSVKRLETQS